MTFQDTYRSDWQELERVEEDRKLYEETLRRTLTEDEWDYYRENDSPPPKPAAEQPVADEPETAVEPQQPAEPITKCYQCYRPLYDYRKECCDYDWHYCKFGGIHGGL